MTSHCITWHDTTQAITSHQMTWPSHDLTPEQTSRHQNTSLQSTKHHHHGRAEGSFTAKKWFGHRAGRSPCAHSIGKFFLCYIVLFLLETSAPGLSGHYWYYISIPTMTDFTHLGAPAFWGHFDLFHADSIRTLLCHGENGETWEFSAGIGWFASLSKESLGWKLLKSHPHRTATWRSQPNLWTWECWVRK